MQIYKAEKSLAERILDNTSVRAYCQLEEVTKEDVPTQFANRNAQIAMAQIPSGTETRFVKAILVTTTWNKNDDVFVKWDTWQAKDTPIGKPTNYGHNESEIIGHTVESWILDEEKEYVDKSLSAEQAPEFFHIAILNVLYSFYSDQDCRDKVEEVVQGVKNQTKFISMECVFNHFDYAMQKDGGIQIIARNEETAFLTRYLRAYGGPGEYQGYKIGRVIRDLVFSGAGYVDNPANPDSVIYDLTLGKENVVMSCTAELHSKAEVDQLVKTKEVDMTKDNTDVSVTDEQIISDQTEVEVQEQPVQPDEPVVETPEVVEPVVETPTDEGGTETTETTPEIPEAAPETPVEPEVTQEAETEVKEDQVALENATLSLQNSKLTRDLEALRSQIETERQEAEQKVIDLEKRLTELQASLDEANVKLGKLQAEDREQVRVQRLIECGFNAEDAKVHVQKLDKFNDEQFDLVIEACRMGVTGIKAEPKVETSEAEVQTEVQETEETDETETALAQVEEAVENAEVETVVVGECSQDHVSQTAKALYSALDICFHKSSKR